MSKKMKIKILKGVRGYIYLVFILFTISMCSTIKEVNREPLSTKYEIKRLKSKSGSSKIIVNSYSDDKYKDKITTVVTINNICFLNRHIGDSILPIKTKVIHSKKYEVGVFSVGFLSLKIKDLYVNKRDSIVINAYLKENNRPIYD